ncbi:hypothetical protein [Micromonospora sp. DT63]|uniref:hypothetical protein n=1 Tax=Micromonospora sp. DT63 TaxID=3393441 RepID=UPI003CE8E2D5
MTPPVPDEPAGTTKPAATRRPDEASGAAQKDGPAPGAGPQQPANPSKRTPRATSARPASTRRKAPAGDVTATTPPPATPAPTTTPTRRTAAPARSTATPAAKSTAAPAKSTPTPAKSAAAQAKRAVAPRKTAVSKKAAPPAEQSPPMIATAPATGPSMAVPASGRTPESDLRAVIARLRDHPGFAPELLALEAVRALGPGAAEWAERLRARYPDAPADGVARLATRRYVWAAGAGGAASALAGLFAPLAELGSVLWTQSNLVLHLAAAYGRDPAHPDRAAELLVLTQVHPDAASAEAALAGARAAHEPVEGTWPRAAEAAWRLAAPLTAQAGGWLALRLASRLLPGAAVVAATLGDAAATDRLAARAIAAYRPRQSQLNQSRGSSA